MRSLSVVASLSLFLSGSMGFKPLRIPIPEPIPEEKVDLTKEYIFHQLIDHNNPELGTFPQRYWYNAEWWKEGGSPVVLFTPGETEAPRYTPYLTDNTTTGLFAKATDGAVVLLEHRYWGTSTPYENLTSETLQYLTLEQSIADLVHFAKTVDLPFDTDHSSNADNAPWVLSGGSYSGALAAWTESTSPGTFWAYHASSAPVEAIYDYWRYFVPVQEGMPKNCSTDIDRVMRHIDHVYQSGNQRRQHQLKKMFGLEGLEYFDDFTQAIENGPWLWQSNTFTTGYSDFYKFCDAVENVEAGAKHVPGSQGVGLAKALRGYAKWFKEEYLPDACVDYGYWNETNSIECFDTHDPANPMYTDLSTRNAFDRQWAWFCCNEPFFYWQSAAPWWHPTLVSRTVTPEYYQRQCPLFFPETNGHTYASAKFRKTTEDINKWTGGWSQRETKRLIYTNGEFDPWRESGVSATGRPGGPMESTPDTPVLVIPGGFHTSDLRLSNGEANEGVMKVIQAQVAQIKTWVEEYYQDTRQ